MPQMAPYNWLNLFYLFNLIWWFIIIFNHFSIIPNIKKKKINKTNYLWKW